MTLAYEEAQRYEAEIADLVGQRDRMEAERDRLHVELAALRVAAIKVVAAENLTRRKDVRANREARRRVELARHRAIVSLGQTVGHPVLHEAAS